MLNGECPPYVEEEVQGLMHSNLSTDVRPLRHLSCSIKKGLLAVFGMILVAAVLCLTVATIFVATHKISIARTDEMLQLNPDEEGVHWGNCQRHEHVPIHTAESMCCSLGVAHHCVTILRLVKDGVAMVEGYGTRPHAYSAVSCHFWDNYTFSNSMLGEASFVCKGMYWSSEPPKQAAAWIGSYASAGYGNEKHYSKTLGGLKDWSLSYLKEFPKYDSLTTNSQKYNIGVYNAVTHSHREEDQLIITSLGSLLAGGVKGSLTASEIISRSPSDGM